MSTPVNPLVYPFTPDHRSDWIWPPALDPEFTVSWMTNPTKNLTKGGEGGGAGNVTRYFEVEVVQNSTRIGGLNFGAENIIVHVGDVVVPVWRTRDGKQNRSVGLSCVVCSMGAVGGEKSIFDACGNYTKAGHLSTTYDEHFLDAPALSYMLPPLSHTFDLPDISVGICYFSLYSASGMTTYDRSIPFPVAQSLRKTPMRFEQANPAGIADSSIRPPLSTVAPTASSEAQDQDRTGLAKGAIVGIAFGVMAGVLIAVIVMVWTAWGRKKKRMANANAQREMELQRVERGGVERRIEKDEYGEAPPAYHEVVRDRGEEGEREVEERFA